MENSFDINIKSNKFEAVFTCHFTEGNKGGYLYKEVLIVWNKKPDAGFMAPSDLQQLFTRFYGSRSEINQKELHEFLDSQFPGSAIKISIHKEIIFPELSDDAFDFDANEMKPNLDFDTDFSINMPAGADGTSEGSGNTINWELPRKSYIPPKITTDRLDKKNEKKYLEFPVFYGTSRKNDSAVPILFGKERDSKLHTGICKVSIPDAREVGEIPRPNWFTKLIYGESPKRYFTILSNELQDEIKFATHLNEAVLQSDEEDILLFIHGYNVSFDEAMYRSAQLGFDLNFKGAVTCFSWPSRGITASYDADVASAEASAFYFKQYLNILLQSQAKKVFIIAHSMGNLLLTHALFELCLENKLPDIKIPEVIFAAPDVDADLFTQKFNTLCGKSRFTLYASDKDKALLASYLLRSGYDRIGQGGMRLKLLNGLETIDASEVDTDFLGHGYFSSTKSLIDDIKMVFYGYKPDKRILSEHQKNVNGTTMPYWTFRST